MEASLTSDPLDPAIIEHFANEFSYKPVVISNATVPYYSDSLHLSRILSWYKDKFSLDDPAHLGASFLIPIGAICALQKLAHFSSNERLVVLSGDKGISDPESMRGLIDPHIAIHGSFSMMVNYHAIGAYFISKGGFALHSQANESSLKVSCFVLPGLDLNEDDTDSSAFDPPWYDKIFGNQFAREKSFPNLLQAFEDYVESFGPNDFFVLQKCLQEESSTKISLRSVLSLLKMSNWDSEIFFKFREIILAQAPYAGIKLRTDFVRGIPFLWRNHFMLDPEKDVAFEIGRILYGLCNYREALVYYQLSADQTGPHHVTFHNMVRCHISLSLF
jgi:hypothetical protein